MQDIMQYYDEHPGFQSHVRELGHLYNGEKIVEQRLYVDSIVPAVSANQTKCSEIINHYFHESIKDKSLPYEHYTFEIISDEFIKKYFDVISTQKEPKKNVVRILKRLNNKIITIVSTTKYLDKDGKEQFHMTHSQYHLITFYTNDIYFVFNINKNLLPFWINGCDSVTLTFDN